MGYSTKNSIHRQSSKEIVCVNDEHFDTPRYLLIESADPYFKITDGRLYLYRKVPRCTFFKDLDKTGRQTARIWAKRPVDKAMGIDFNFNDYRQSTSIRKNSSIIGAKYINGKGTVFLVEACCRIAVNSNLSSHQEVMASLADSGLTYDRILDLEEKEAWSEKCDGPWDV